VWESEKGIFIETDAEINTVRWISVYIRGYKGEDFLSGLLDMTIIKPMIDCIMGKDIITGERLPHDEITWKMIGVCIDLFTLGKGAMAIKGAGQTGKQALKAYGKVVLVDGMSNVAGYTAADTESKTGTYEFGSPLKCKGVGEKMDVYAEDIHDGTH